MRNGVLGGKLFDRERSDGYIRNFSGADRLPNSGTGVALGDGEKKPVEATTLKSDDKVPPYVNLRGAGAGLPPSGGITPPLPAETSRVLADPSRLVTGDDTSNIRFNIGNRPVAGYDSTLKDPYAGMSPLQKLEAQIGTERDYKGFSPEHPYIGKDRDKDHNWKDVLRSIAIGGLQGLGTGGGLGAGLGGAIAGGIAGATDRHFDNRWQDALKDNALREQYGTLQQMELAKEKRAQEELDTRIKGVDLTGKNLANIKTQGEIAKIPGELAGQNITNINNRIKPLLDIIDKTQSLTPEYARQLNELSGLKFNPEQWKKYIDIQRNGTTLTRSETDPRFAENKTVPIDPTEVPRNIQIGSGQPLPLTPKQAAPVIAAQENANAGRRQQQSQFEQTQQLLKDKFDIDTAIEIQKYNTDQYGRYQGNAQTFKKELAKANAEIKANTPLLAAYDQQIANADLTISSIDPTNPKADRATLRAAEAAKAEAIAKKAEAQGKIDAATYFMTNVEVPEPNQTLRAPRKLGGGSRSQAKPTKDPLGLFK